MTLWRLEALRLWRTRRWLAVLGVYLFFGLLGPFTARYLADILSLAGGDLEGATIEIPPPVPADGLAQFAGNAGQIGTLVAVVVAAASLSIDAIPEMGAFLRTRVASVRDLLVPRVAVASALLVGSFVVGALAAWYETWVLIGAPDAVGTLIGIAYGALFQVFVVALVAAVAARSSSNVGAVIVSIVVLLAMPIIGVVEVIGRWLPTRLVGAIGPLAGGADPTEFLPAVAAAIVGSAGLLWLAGVVAARREL